MHQKHKGKGSISSLKYVRIGDISKSMSQDVVHSNEHIEKLDNLKRESSGESAAITQEGSVQANNEVRNDTQINQQANQYSKETSEKPSKFKYLPKFVQNIIENQEIVTPQEPVKSNPVMNLSQKLPVLGLPGSINQNPNSFASAFSNNHEEINSIQRVFRKSLVFLILQLIAFAGLAMISISLLNSSWVLLLLVIIGYVTFSNLFYIIVADKSYVFISIVSQVLILLITHAFIGLSFDRVTLIATAIIAAMIYISYGELEKVQLSSRLFSISLITSESARALSTIVLLTLCLGVFNTALSQGGAVFTDSILSKPLIMDNLVIGRFQNVSLNSVLMKGRFSVEAGFAKVNKLNSRSEIVKQTALFSDFLAANYKPGEVALSEVEKEDILTNCRLAKTTPNCNDLVDEVLAQRLEDWRLEAYSKLPYTLDTELTLARFQNVTKQFYINEVNRFNSGGRATDSNDLVDNLSRLLILPRVYILPAIVALMVFLILSIVKPIINWLSYITTLIFWNLLKLSGLVRIDIENVEAEIVSI